MDLVGCGCVTQVQSASSIRAASYVLVDYWYGVVLLQVVLHVEGSSTHTLDIDAYFFVVVALIQTRDEG